MIRPQVIELLRLGTFPSERDVVLAKIEKQQGLLESIESPVSNDEARELIKLFGPDSYFGLAWAVLHLMESAPGWPLEECLQNTNNEWIQDLRRRIENAKRFGLMR